MRYVCTVHKVTLVVEGNNRRYQTPAGSYMKGVPRCSLLTQSQPQAGQAGECRIEVK